MDALPTLVPRYVDQRDDVAWPQPHWPRANAAPDVVAAADAAFDDPALGETNAVLVVSGGRLIYERYAGAIEHFDRASERVDENSALLSWSMAKSILHLGIGRLVEAGRLDPTSRAPVAAWSDERAAIRLSDLLAMRDGLDFIEEYVLGEPSHVIEMLFGEGKPDVARYAAAKPLAHEPGTVFNYSSGTTNILSGIVADLVGRHDAYRAFLDESVFSPLAMTSATAGFDDAGVFIASSFVHATARDFAKFGLCYLRGGRFADTQVVSRAWTDTAQIPLSRDEESGHFYAWQWWVTGDEYGTYWASGYEGQMISVVPGLDALVLRFGHTAHENYPDLYRWRARVLDALSESAVVGEA
jgi:CubicO group peptidase (beta-lactamase class C family)